MTYSHINFINTKIYIVHTKQKQKTDIEQAEGCRRVGAGG